MYYGEKRVENPIRWGMVGGGRGSQIGYIHRSAALRDLNFELVAGAFDIDPERGKDFGKQLHVDPDRCYPDYKTMFAEEAKRPDGVQAVSIATPNGMHYEVCKAALEAGLHVVCEKPLCFSSEEADELVALSQRRRKIIGVTYGYAGHQLILQARQMFQQAEAKYKESIKAEAAKAREVGGLFILGTERHESRRIDNQLRGRSGRQGDPGESRFYLSLQDDLMRLFSSDRIMNMMDSLGLDEDTPIDAKILSGAVENAQKNVESRNFKARKNVLEYDDVMNTQREVIYAQRQKVLDGEDLRENILTMLRSLVDTNVATALSENGGSVNEEALKELAMQMEGIYFIRGTLESRKTQLLAMDQQTLANTIYDIALATYQAKETAYGDKLMRELERVVMLRVVDEYWMDNIDAMDDLKQGIGLRAYGQHDPVVAYKEEGYQMFESMIQSIKDETVRRMFLVRVQPQQEVKREKVAKETGAAGAADGSSVKKQPIRTAAKKVGPNDPCPCGSGKKYKKCCMQKDKEAGMEQ